MDCGGWFVILALLGIVSCDGDENTSTAADDESGVKFYLCTRNNQSGEQIQEDIGSILSAGWNPGVPTRVLVHGWMNTHASPMMTTLITAFLREGDYNVIAVDWRKYAEIAVYPLARSNVKRIGTAVGNFLQFLIKQGLLQLQSLHVIGHSLGAHVAGNAGKAIAARGGNVSRITGLDPALPGFSENPGDSLSKDDALVVDVIHTNGGWMGFYTPLGQVDFYPNGGRKQPGCMTDLTGQCDHGRSYELFAESILNKNAFKYAHRMEWSKFITLSSVSRGSELAQMGYWLKYSRPGSYYLETAAKSPYDLGNNSR